MGLGTVIRRAFPIVVARAPTAEATDKYTLGGPLCTPADEVAANLQLPTVRSGDLIGILGSGAYGLTFSNALFLSHPLPAEVMVEGGGRLAAALLSKGLVDEVHWFVAPKLLGEEGRPALGALPIAVLADAIALENVVVRQVGEDVHIRGEVPRQPGPGRRSTR